MNNLLINFFLWLHDARTDAAKDERGVTATEYFLLGAVIVAVVLIAATGLGNKILDLANRIPVG